MPKVENKKYKVQIDSLPKGFDLVDGQLVKKSHGGYVTGDQFNYGLTTFNTHADQSTGPSDTDVRYSLSSVPRDEANIEAEGGETVLTDLSNDGQFGLYDIKGPRHTKGGVPMFLPEQSFIFSDTKDMRMNKNEIAEHGIETKKQMTPAAVSKNFQLNKYYGLLNDEYADKIQANTADLMLQKNKESLSKLAFGQELKKDFEDGVPAAAYPYLQSIGMDPFQFSEQVASLSKFTGQEQPQMNQADMSMMAPVMGAARNGRELPKAQVGPGAMMDAFNFTQPGSGYFNELMTNDYASTKDIVADAQMQNQNPAMGPTPYQQKMDKLLTEGTGVPATEDGQGSMTPVNPADPKVTRDKGTLGSQLDRGVSNLMSSPAMKKIGETAKLATGLADVGNEFFKNKKFDQAQQDRLKMTMADNYVGVNEDPMLKKGVYDPNSGLAYGTMQGEGPSGFAGYKAAEYGKELTSYQDKGEVSDDDYFMGGTDEWVDWYTSDENKDDRDMRYKIFQLENPKSKLSQEDFDKIYIRGQKQIAAMEDFYADNPDYLNRSDWDSYYEYDPKYKNYDEAKKKKGTKYRGKNFRYKKFIEDYNKKLREDNAALPEDERLSEDEINAKVFQALDDQGIRDFQSAYIASQKRDLSDKGFSEYNEFIQSGRDDNTIEIDGKVYNISPSDGSFGNTTNRQRERSRIPAEPTPVVKEPCPACEDGTVLERNDNGECPPCETRELEVPDVEVQQQPIVKEPWIQDVLKTNAIANRERDMFLPWQPGVRRTNLDVVLENPDRQIAAINAGLAGQMQGLGAFAGPQAMSARSAQAQGSAIDAIANAVAGVNARNVNTINQANLNQANLDQQANQLEDARRTKQYDDTMKTLQTYMDEKNFDREQYADAISNQITNMSNTYNRNQIEDYFNIDPSSGGDIIQVGKKDWNATTPKNEYAWMKEYADVMKRMKTQFKDMDDKDRKFLWEEHQRRKGVNPSINSKQEAFQNAARNYMAGAQRQDPNARKGKEMKRWAVPFYSGKMGI